MTDAEDIRHSLLVCLYGARQLPMPASFFVRRCHKDTGATEAAILAELHYHTDAGHCAATPDPDGSTLYYKITPAGVLHYERNR